MNNQEAIRIIKTIEIDKRPVNNTVEACEEVANRFIALDMAIKALEQEPTTRNCFGCKYSKDNHNSGMEECHLCMWENQYTPQEPFINKPCVSSGVCEHDKQKILDTIRAEIEDLDIYYDNDYFSTNNCPMYKCNEVLLIIDKYKTEK